MKVQFEPHPLLVPVAFVTNFPRTIGEMPSPDTLRALLTRDAVAPFVADDALRQAIRTLLRHGGFKPSGRSKPASEYLVRAIEEGALDSINVAVDACNVVSYHSGIPISVVDLDRVREPLHVGVARPGERYVFNASGQEMDLSGLLCLSDTQGPCANAVKDSQRTKTAATTRSTLSILWGSTGLTDVVVRAGRWYRDLLEGCGATTEDIDVTWQAS